ncbi:DUF1993 domain-containing protein [Herminiimonas arsenitoxidans]|uniref:DUF1993 domain-containing protein n=1 Tax=Herminiimonas arsenitoxidans TaxID=1809410 RepID=UPI0009706062|nr:DUF1993 domain-containing protein [Herminiimonas arsenitoxidans]
MTISLYAASVPVFKQMLNSVSDILKKTEEYATAKSISPDAYLQARLFPDMFPLIRQVQVACDFSRGISSRLAGVEVPKFDDSEKSFADLQVLITKTLAVLNALTPAQIDGQEEREIVLRAGTPKEKKFNGQAYLLTFGLPQFFFHITTTYAILRHNGIEIGKRDYMGAY